MLKPCSLQVHERRAGALALQQKQHSAAAAHYERALAVTRVIAATNKDDQAEVDSCQEAALLGLAAARLELKEYQQVVLACTEVLSKNKGCTSALLRRSRALLGMHEIKVRGVI
jgi:hypothetical protein